MKKVYIEMIYFLLIPGGAFIITNPFKPLSALHSANAASVIRATGMFLAS